MIIDFGLSIFSPSKNGIPELFEIPVIPLDSEGNPNFKNFSLEKINDLLRPKSLLDDWYDLGKLMYELYDGKKAQSGYGGTRGAS